MEKKRVGQKKKSYATLTFMAEVKLKGNVVHTKGNLPSVGTQAPNFVLVDLDLKNRSLFDYQGKRKLIYVVPSLDTPTCLTSTKKLDEAASRLQNSVILIVSCDLPFAMKRICSLEGMQKVIPLSMMRSKDFGHDYGVLLTDGPIAGLTARAVVVLDENNKVLYTELVEEMSDEPNYDAALERLG